LDGLICLFYYTTPVKEIIHELKYRFVRDLQAALAVEIRGASVLKKVDFDSFTLVPVPLSQARQLWRGFNQAEIIGKNIAKQLKVPFAPEVLKKTKETKPQAKLARAERLRQVAGVFKASPEISGRNFLLFDDVWTTGATMKAAAAALKRKGAVKVWGLALASSH
jgi:ComF family protein